jgi:hypothetical protein|tara:strand:- start:15 stop:197 length:183 start_codon:yes stop_codon:yes gene_type:complete
MLNKTCFQCNVKTTKKTAWTVEMNTAEGKHKINLCEPCGVDFNKLAIELQEVLDERPEPI